MPSIHQNFNHDWLFLRDDQSAFSQPGFDDSSWRKLNVPHDWSIETLPEQDNPTCGNGGFVQAGIAWYRKHFAYDPAFDGKIVSLMFGGVFMDSHIYLNGEEVGSNLYGYSSFSVDLTKALKPGDNVLAIRVDNSKQPNSRWYTGSGIYRNVWLNVFDPVHVAQWGVFFYTSKLTDDGAAELSISTKVENASAAAVNAKVTQTLTDCCGKEVLKAGAEVLVGAGETGEVKLYPVFANPHLWTDTDPYLYTLTTTVEVDGKQVDATAMKVGVRTATFHNDRGFLLNGKSVKIKGMCLHHDCGLTGAVGYRESWERRLKALKDMGCNGIRCAHNPPSDEMLEVADELGFLIMDEAFDEWFTIKGKGGSGQQFGSGVFFGEQADNILTTMLHRDRNHPSVVLWSIGNEIPEQYSMKGVEIAKHFHEICHREDPTRMITSACDGIAATGGGTLKEFEEALDVVGYNYVDRWRERAETLYDEDKRAYPYRCVIGSENASAGGDRGQYIPRDKGRPFRFDYHIWTLKHEWLWRYTVSRDFVAGDYLWTGVDYLGECGWPRRGSGSGPIDSAGFPKDTYYYFRSVWNKDDLTLHILPHWNWKGSEGEYIQVVVYTNCDKVDLFINDRKVGTKACGAPYYGAETRWNQPGRISPTTHDLHLTFDVAYEPGTLRAVGYKNGEVAMETVMETTGAPVSLKAEADRCCVKPDGIVQIDLSAFDAEGREVADATPLIKCEVLSGPAHLVGMDAGDMYDLSLYSESERHMSAGRLMAMLMADAPGEVQVQFTAEGLTPATVSFKVGEEG